MSVANDPPSRHVVRFEDCPQAFPTQRHSAEFWEWLGRTVATYGFLEEVLGKAIFAFTGTKEYSDDQIATAMEKWHAQLEAALVDTLHPLIDAYAASVRRHHDATLENLDELVEDLRKAASLRNALCHGSWRMPDEQGRSLPHFVARKDMKVFDTPIDIDYLRQLQRHLAELAVAVINSVSHMGWQFPGSAGPGKPVWPKDEPSG